MSNKNKFCKDILEVFKEHYEASQIREAVGESYYINPHILSNIRGILDDFCYEECDKFEGIDDLDRWISDMWGY